MPSNQAPEDRAQRIRDDVEVQMWGDRITVRMDHMDALWLCDRVTELTEALRELRDAVRSYQRFMNREISERAGIVIASSDEFVDALFRATQLLAPEQPSDKEAEDA